MDPQRTTNADALVDTQARQLNERAVDQTVDHIAAARKRADTADDLIAEDAWRDLARLASRLHREEPPDRPRRSSSGCTDDEHPPVRGGDRGLAERPEPYART